jgi:hypothetical protein
MLLINQRLDKLAAARSYYISRDMLPPDHLKPPESAVPIVLQRSPNDEDEGMGEEASGGWTDERVLADVKLARRRGAWLCLLVPIL